MLQKIRPFRPLNFKCKILADKLYFSRRYDIKKLGFFKYVKEYTAKKAFEVMIV
jgi:hypothetical protein